MVISRSPGLPIRHYAENHNNCIPWRSKLSAMIVTSKAFFERLYLVLGLSRFSPSHPYAPTPLSWQLFLDFGAILILFFSARFIFFRNPTNSGCGTQTSVPPSSWLFVNNRWFKILNRHLARAWPSRHLASEAAAGCGLLWWNQTRKGVQSILTWVSRRLRNCYCDSTPASKSAAQELQRLRGPAYTPQSTVIRHPPRRLGTSP